MREKWHANNYQQNPNLRLFLPPLTQLDVAQREERALGITSEKQRAALLNFRLECLKRTQTHLVPTGM
jgi:hypothetical protein